ncbi:hypothetical protein Tdes44962_MAKER02769 [Teratosphaeria destructans]|uniref:Uncharacterized protein n=1 Tax=Teratosphaeria destructans TaxID=418781 RepID=A0A9W7SSQ5_9PEZI|nr:hypothetical protein Tdes44962_MAKER02769 [Teratosphaeria destructans]
MSDSNLIDRLVGLEVEDGSAHGSVDLNTEEVRIDTVDKDMEMMEMMRSMKMTMESLAQRMDKLEVEVKTVKMSLLKSKPKDMFTMPNPDAHRQAHTLACVHVEELGGVCGQGRRYRVVHGREFVGPSVFASSGGTNSRSALASRGYDNKLQVWGVGFASLMYACIKMYMQWTGETGHVIDGIVLMKTYTNIVDVLYARIKSADLPAVQADSSNFMATLFARRDSNSLPESTARDWFELSQHSDGVECMSVIESIFMAAKMVPEAMGHPISQLIPQMLSPVVRNTSKGPSFSIVSTAKVTMSPNGHENFCKYLKMEALKTYVRHRLDGKSEHESMAVMAQLMKDTEMFDGKNLQG